MIELVALLTAVVVLGTAVTTYRTRRQVQQVHVMVNSQRAQMTEELAQLKAILIAAGVPVPPPPPIRGPASED